MDSNYSKQAACQCHFGNDAPFCRIAPQCATASGGGARSRLPIRRPLRFRIHEKRTDAGRHVALPANPSSLQVGRAERAPLACAAFADSRDVRYPAERTSPSSIPGTGEIYAQTSVRAVDRDRAT